MKQRDIMNILLGMISKIGTIFSTLYSSILALFGIVITFLLPLKMVFIILAVLIFLDFVFGIIASLKLKIPLTSHKFRSTIIKSFIYLVVLSSSFAIETVLGLAIAYKVLFGIASLIELYSVVANLLIIKPDMPFLRLFKILIIDEIANKISKSNTEITNLLDNKK